MNNEYARDHFSQDPTTYKVQSTPSLLLNPLRVPGIGKPVDQKTTSAFSLYLSEFRLFVYGLVPRDPRANYVCSFWENNGITKATSLSVDLLKRLNSEANNILSYNMAEFLWEDCKLQFRSNALIDKLSQLESSQHLKPELLYSDYLQKKQTKLMLFEILYNEYLRDHPKWFA